MSEQEPKKSVYAALIAAVLALVVSATGLVNNWKTPERNDHIKEVVDDVKDTVKAGKDVYDEVKKDDDEEEVKEAE